MDRELGIQISGVSQISNFAVSISNFKAYAGTLSFEVKLEMVMSFYTPASQDRRIL
jgi:hypothetical protein